MTFCVILELYTVCADKFKLPNLYTRIMKKLFIIVVAVFCIAMYSCTPVEDKTLSSAKQLKAAPDTLDERGEHEGIQ